MYALVLKARRIGKLIGPGSGGRKSRRRGSRVPSRDAGTIMTQPERRFNLPGDDKTIRRRPQFSGGEDAGWAGFVLRGQVAVDGEVVEIRPGEAPGEGGEDRNPEVIIVGLEDGWPPAEQGGGESRSEFPGGVDGVAGQAPEGQADGPDEGSQGHRLHVSPGSGVPPIGQGADSQEQDSGAQEFAEDVSPG